MPSVILGETPFAVVDLETTGLNAGGFDKIIEIAVVRLRPNLDIEDTWSTLVNPKRDIGSAAIHGIRSGDVLHAPTFEEIAADVGERLSGAVVVGHHLRFDLTFLLHEYERCGVRLPAVPALCTLALAHRLLPDAPSRKLAYCCEQVAIMHEEEHDASQDATATAHLLTRLLERGQQQRLSTLEEFGCVPIELPPSGWFAALARIGTAMGRAPAAERRGEDRSYLARLVERMPGDESRNPQEAEYLALIDRALEDRIVTPQEATLLVDMAESWGMKRADVADAHRAYLASLVSEAMSDGVVTAAERRDLVDVCDMLGLHRVALEALLAAPARPLPPGRPQEEPASLRGKLVCFTGELAGKLDGELITREIAHRLAIEAGVGVRESVTKALDILVVADPDTQSLKAKKARQYGIRIMAEAAFWRVIGVRAH